MCRILTSSKILLSSLSTFSTIHTKEQNSRFLNLCDNQIFLANYQASKSHRVYVITKSTTNNVNRNGQISLATKQSSKRWSTDSTTFADTTPTP